MEKRSKQARPYKEQGQIRTFSKDTPQEELCWHRDREDRYVQALEDNDWMLQLDNELPKKMHTNQLFIPKDTYHRIIKGTKDVNIKVIKCKN